ncbi:MAG: CHAT domain-containing protein [Cyanobacteriota bacterium]|nr:CHAT domain-containing protein [Cyanobacteriota bacterium]
MNDRPHFFTVRHRWLKSWKIWLRIGLAVATFVLVVSTTALAQIPSGETRPISVELDATTPLLLEREGRELYDGGQFSAAADAWGEAARQFAALGDILGQAGSLSYRSMALYELGEFEAAQADLDRALQLLPLDDRPGGRAILAQVLNNLGRIQLARGNAQLALDTWRDAFEAYEAIEDRSGALGASINQAIALQALGLYRQASSLLDRVDAQLTDDLDSRLQATGLRNLGIALQVVGDLKRAREVLERSLVASRQLDFAPEISATLRALGNTARVSEDPETALAYFQEAAIAARELPGPEISARLNILSLLVELERWEEAREQTQILRDRMGSLPIGRSTVYAKVNFAENLIRLELQRSPQRPSSSPQRPTLERGETFAELAQLLAEAIEIARTLEDSRAESYATGQLAHVYEVGDRLDDATALTQKALSLSLGNGATDITAKWATQLGRILKRQGQFQEAISAYSEAVRALGILRKDLVSIDPDIQFSFQESIEPVYRELVGLLLQSPHPSQANLIEARETIEALQIAELDNFFREACLTAQSVSIDDLDPTAAVIYPIILPMSEATTPQTRIEVLLSLPGEPLRNYKTVLPQEEFDETVSQFRQSLSLSFPKSKRLATYSLVYDWLLRPIETDLEERGIETLVFVLDGSLRNLPMSVLFDGDRYLLEKYSLALAPGLQLLEPQSLDNSELKASIGGLSKSSQGFPALPYVEFELEQVEETIASEVWLDGEFTTEAIRGAIAQTARPILHLATHGQFSSNASETFILTWDGRIPVTELGTLLQSRDETRDRAIELLVLSACQTAKGDNRAILGLAGFAVKSGARSTLGTLWTVWDRSTAKLMARFYQELSVPGTHKSEALRQAQLSLLQQPEYEHPFYWAPFVLVGNWL